MPVKLEPCIVLRGWWLREVGFAIGDRVTVTVNSIRGIHHAWSRYRDNIKCQLVFAQLRIERSCRQFVTRRCSGPAKAVINFIQNCRQLSQAAELCLKANLTNRRMYIQYTYNVHVIDFEWDEAKAKSNLKKHGITFLEAKSVFFDEYAVQFYDPAGSELEEDRFLMLGTSNESNILIVCHCERHQGNTIRIISARKATKNERKHYEGE